MSRRQPPAIRLRGVSKVYGSGSRKSIALRNVDLDLRKGEFVLLLGPEGSGKSTLLNIIAGLERPSAGSVLVGRRDLTKASEAVLAEYRQKRVGFVAPSPKFLPKMTVQENVRLVAQMSSRPMRADAALALVGLGKRLNDFPSELSPTERYLLAFARVMAKRPEILVCDEQTVPLGLENAATVVKTLELATAILDMSIIVSTRNVRLRKFAERVVHLIDGRLVGERRRLPPEW